MSSINKTKTHRVELNLMLKWPKQPKYGIVIHAIFAET